MLQELDGWWECCRNVFSCPVFLCIWHVTKAWLEQLRQKLLDKTQLRAVFLALYNIMFMHHSDEDSVHHEMDRLKETFPEEKRVHDWIQRAWTSNVSTQLCPIRW